MSAVVAVVFAYRKKRLDENERRLAAPTR